MGNCSGKPKALKDFVMTEAAASIIGSTIFGMFVLTGFLKLASVMRAIDRRDRKRRKAEDSRHKELQESLLRVSRLQEEYWEEKADEDDNNDLQH